MGVEGAGVLGEVTDYPSMMRILRERANDLHINRSGEETAKLSGLPDRYLSKLLGPRPVRRIGMRSMGAVLGVLQIKFIAVVDEEAVRRYGNRVQKRDERLVRSGTVTIELSRRHMKAIGRKGGQARFKLPAREIKRLARAAGRARQAKRRLAQQPINWNAAKKAAKQGAKCQKCPQSR